MALAKNKVFVAGHNGMVGSAIVRKLSLDRNIELILASRDELDLLDALAVEKFFNEKQPDQSFRLDLIYHISCRIYYFKYW